MSQFVEVKTAELVGPALDWAVAMAEFWEADRPQDGQIRKGDVYMLVGPFRLIGLGVDKFYSPSTNWAQGGPLIEQFGLDLWKHEGKFYAFHTRQHNKYCADTVLVAACLAIVAAKLGDVVQVPAELVGVTA